MNAEIYLTSRCNLRCNFCGCGDLAQGGSLSIEDAKHFLSDIRQQGYRYVSFSGGEPFLSGALMELADIACMQGMLVNVTTNGTLIDEEYASFAAKRNVMTRISLHTLDPKQYEEMTGGSLERVFRSVELMRMGKAGFAFGATISEENTGQVGPLSDYALKCGAAYIRFTPVFRIYKGSKYNTASEDFEKLLKAVSCQIIRKKEQLEYAAGDPLVNDRWAELFLTGACAAGSDMYIALKSNKRLAPCPVIPEDAVPVCYYDRSAKSISRFKDMYEALMEGNDPDSLLGSCGMCRYKSSCRGGCASTRISMSAKMQEEQPVCILKIVENVLDAFSKEEREVLKSYWSYWSRSKQFPGGSVGASKRTCIRALPIWELHFRRRRISESRKENDDR